MWKKYNFLGCNIKISLTPERVTTPKVNQLAIDWLASDCLKPLVYVVNWCLQLTTETDMDNYK